MMHHSSGPSLVSHKRHNIVVKSGSITTTPADVLVNCVGNNDPDLDGCGAVAKVFLAAAGKKFGDSYRNSGGLGDWVVSCASPEALPCKMVCHMSIRDWNGNTTKQVIYQLLN